MIAAPLVSICSSSPSVLPLQNVTFPQSLVALASLKSFPTTFILSPTTFYSLLFPLFSGHWSPLTALHFHLVPEFPLLPFTSTSELTSPLSSGACGLGKCWQHQGLLPALCTWFLPCKAGSSGRIGSTVHKEPVCQQGTNQQAGVQPVRVCTGLN